MLQKSNWSKATYLSPNQDLDPSAAFYGHAARGAVYVMVIWDRTVFPFLFPRYPGRCPVPPPQ